MSPSSTTLKNVEPSNKGNSEAGTCEFMKSNQNRNSFQLISRYLTVLAFVVLGLFLVQSSLAQTSYTWTGGGGNGNWTTGANWGGTGPSGNPQGYLNFDGSTRLNNTNDFAAASAGFQFYFKSTAGVFNLYGNSIKFYDFNSVDPNIQNEGTANTQTINFPFVNANTHGANGILNINLNAAPAQGPLTFNGTISAADTTIATRAINISGAGAVKFNGVISDFSSSGKIALTQLGAGTTTLNAVNTFTGDTTITAGTIQLGDGISLNGAVGGNIVDNAALIVANPTALTYSGVISGSGTLTKKSSGTLTLNRANTYGGLTTLSGGKILLDFSAGGAPANNIISTSSALKLGGGSVQILGASGGSAQTFASTAISATTSGQSGISAAPVSGTIPTVSLGVLTGLAGGLVRIDGAAYNSGASSGTTLGGTTVAATATYNVTANTINGGILSVSTAANAAQAYGTVGLYDWAGVSGGTVGTAQAGTIVGGSQISGFYTTVSTPSSASTFNLNLDLTASATMFANANVSGAYSTIRFNAASAVTLTTSKALGGSVVGGLLITPNVGANNITIAPNTAQSQTVIQCSRATSAATGLTIWQNNTSGELIITANYNNGSNTGATSSYSQGGPGSVLFNAANGYTGQSFLNGGYTVISANTGLGAIATGAAVNMNGGTLFGNATLTLDNAGAAPNRGIFLSGAGGTLAASAGNTLTVNGVVSGSATLTIGTGTIAGTGAGTANTTAIVGSGTVVFSGANTYSGVTTLVNGTANINGINALGGGNYSGINFNGGTLQYATTLTSGSDLSTGNGITLASGGGTVDVNGNSVTYANAIGFGGSGALTVKSTAANGVLILQGDNTYSGGTTISSGTLKATNTSGSATGSGSVTVASGATLGGGNTARTQGFITGVVTVNNGGILAPGNSVGTLTVGSLTLNSTSTNNFEFNTSTPTNDQVVVTTSSGLTLNGGKFNLYVEGGSTAFSTAGTYNLIQYSGAVSGSSTSGGNLDSTWTTSSASNPHIANPQSGYLYAFDLSGGSLRVTITQGATVGSWNVDANGNWTDTANWLGGSVPGANSGVSGDSATFAGTTTTAARTVTLNANESVGSITMNQANAFTISGGSTLTLDNKTAGATLQVTAGTANAISTAVSLNDTATATVSSGKSLSVSGNISSTSTSKTLTVNGAGTLALSGNNTYGPVAAGTTGTTLSGGGTLQVGSSTALSAGDLSVTASGTLQASGSVSLANNVVLGTATVTVDSATPDNLTLGVVSGSGGALTKTGSGTVTLGSAATYFNNTAISAGTLKLGVANAIPNGGSTTGWLILDGGDSVAGTLDLNGLNQTVNALSGNTSTVLGQIVNNSGSGTSTLTVAGNTTTFAGLIKDNNNSTSGKVALGFSGAPVLTLSGANTYSGGTTIGAGQTLKFGGTSAIGTGTLNINGGTLDSTVASLVNAGNNAQNWNADFTFTGTQNLDFGSGTATMVGATRTVTVSANTLTVGAISDGGNNYGVIKAGGGQLTLSGNGTYTGGTTISAGTVKLTSNTGAGTGNITATAQLRLGNGVIVSNGFTANQTFTCLDVPDISATAIYTGIAANSAGGMRFAASGSGAILIFSNATVNISSGSKTFWPERGNIVYAGTTVINNAGSAGGAVLGRSAGNAVALTIKDSATANHTTFSLGESGGINSSVSLTLQDSATLSCSTFNALATSIAGPNTINLNGGTLAATSITKGNANAETMNWNGGTIKATASSTTYFSALSGLTVNVGTGGAKLDNNAKEITIGQALLGAVGDGGLTSSGSGTNTLTGANTYFGGTVVKAGTLNINGKDAIGGANYAGITVSNAATLQYATTLTSASDLSTASVTLGAGGGTVDVNGNTVTYANAIGNSGSGSLTVKAGSGSLTLNGANSYSGNTTVSSGTLTLASGATISSTQITVASGAVLDVSASGLTLGSGKTLTAGRTSGSGTDVNGNVSSTGSTVDVTGASSRGTLSLNGNLSLSGSTVKFDIAGASADAINLGSSTLTLSGATTTIDVTQTALNPGTYHLITASSMSGGLGNLSLAVHGSLGRVLAELATTSTTVDLVVTVNPTNLVWQGDGGNNYWTNDVNTLVWSNTVGELTYYSTGDFVAFDNTATNLLVNIRGAVSPGTITVNTTNDLTFTNSGSGYIAGATGLTKQNTNTLTVRITTNAYTGVTTLSGGTVSVSALANGGSPSAIGAADTNAANLVLDGGTLKYTGGSQSIDREFTVTANGGEIDAAQGSSTTYLRLTPSVVRPLAMSGTGNRTFTIGGTGGGTSSTSRNFLGLSVGDPSSGSTSLKKTGTGPWTMGTGGHTYSGDTIIDQGTLEATIDNPLPFGTGKGNLLINSGANFAAHSQTIAINALNDGTGGGGTITTTLATSKPLTIGNGNASGSFSGTINFGVMSLVKTGAGTQTLSGVSTYTGSTTVNGGTLALSGSGSIANSSTITVAVGATLDVSGLTSGDYSTPATLSLKVDKTGVTLTQGQVNAGSTVVTAGGALTVTATGSTLTGGESFALFSATPASTFTATNLPSLSAGLNWWTGDNYKTLVVNRAPTASDLTMGAQSGVPVSATIIGGKHPPVDLDGNSMTLSSVGTALHGTVSITDGSNITYTAASDYAGSDSFTYTVSDNHGASVTATVNMTVTAGGEGYNRLGSPENLNDGSFKLTYLGVPGEKYALDWAGALTSPVSWTPQFTNTAAANGFVTYTNSQDTNAMNFWRTRYVP